MHDELWAGVNIKIQYATFHFLQMWRSLDPPERTHTNVVLEAAGAILDTGWQQSFYPHFDAFLTAARSVPELINACFGADTGSREMTAWYQTLDQDEKDRRSEFTRQFDDTRRAFGKLSLSEARNVSVHRTGVTPVTVATTGFFGVTYTGDQIKSIPGSETRQIDDPQYAFLAKPLPLRPKWSDFYFGSQQLHPECQTYLTRVQEIANDARTLVEKVHGQNKLTKPPG